MHQLITARCAGSFANVRRLSKSSKEIDRQLTRCRKDKCAISLRWGVAAAARMLRPYYAHHVKNFWRLT